MKSMDILTSVAVFLGAALLVKSLLLFPIATAIFILSVKYSNYALAYLIAVSIFTAIWYAIDVKETARIKKIDGNVTFSRSWELLWEKKAEFLVGGIILLLNFISAYLLLKYIPSLDAILLLAYGITGYIFTSIYAFLNIDISLKGLIVRFVSDWFNKK